MTNRFHITFDREGSTIDMMLPKNEIEKADGIELVKEERLVEDENEQEHISEVIVDLRVVDREAFEEYIAMFMGGNDVNRQASNIIPELVQIQDV